MSRNLSVTDSWTVLNEIEKRIKEKIEKLGKPLKEWDIQINYGIKTGFNEAFIISTEKRAELVDKCPKSAEIIRPILLGKNVKRFYYKWENHWLINSHNGIKSKHLPRVNLEEDYPALFEYLSQFKEKLMQRLDQGDHWSNLRNCAYLEEFYKPKIAWGNLALNSQFAFISGEYLINNPSPFFVTDNLYFLAILDSRVADYYLKQLGVSRSGGYMEYKPMFVEKLPIPKISEEEQLPFVKLVEAIINNKKNGTDSTLIEREIDNMVFQLYSLTEDEKQIISAIEKI